MKEEDLAELAALSIGPTNLVASERPLAIIRACFTHDKIVSASQAHDGLATEGRNPLGKGKEHFGRLAADCLALKTSGTEPPTDLEKELKDWFLRKFTVKAATDKADFEAFLCCLFRYAAWKAETASDDTIRAEYARDMEMFLMATVLTPKHERKTGYKPLLENILVPRKLVSETRPQLSDSYGQGVKRPPTAAEKENDDKFRGEAIRFILAHIFESDYQEKAVDIKAEQPAKDEQAVEKKAEEDALNNPDYQELRSYFFEVRYNCECVLRNGKVIQKKGQPLIYRAGAGFKNFREKVKTLEKEENHVELFRLLTLLKEYLITNNPCLLQCETIATAAQGGDDDVKVVVVVDLEEAEVIDVDNYFIDVVLLKVVKPEAGQGPPPSFIDPKIKTEPLDSVVSGDKSNSGGILEDEEAPTKPSPTSKQASTPLGVASKVKTEAAEPVGPSKPSSSSGDDKSSSGGMLEGAIETKPCPTTKEASSTRVSTASSILAPLRECSQQASALKDVLRQCQEDTTKDQEAIIREILGNVGDTVVGLEEILSGCRVDDGVECLEQLDRFLGDLIKVTAHKPMNQWYLGAQKARLMLVGLSNFLKFNVKQGTKKAARCLGNVADMLSSAVQMMEKHVAMLEGAVHGASLENKVTTPFPVEENQPSSSDGIEASGVTDTDLKKKLPGGTKKSTSGAAKAGGVTDKVSAKAKPVSKKKAPPPASEEIITLE